MKHYIDKNGELHGYDDGRATPDGMREITIEQIAETRQAERYTAQALKDAATTHRWKVETGGVSLPDGTRVATTTDDQNRISNAIANARIAGIDSVDFKAASGWVTLSVSQMEQIAAAIALHVQACFSAERRHHEQIDALATLHEGDPEALEEAMRTYDEQAGWPEGSLEDA